MMPNVQKKKSVLSTAPPSTYEEYKKVIHNFNEIDELILPAITAFNDLGYRTFFSCEGHYVEKDNKKFYIQNPYLVMEYTTTILEEAKALSKNNPRYTNIQSVPWESTLTDMPPCVHIAFPLRRYYNKQTIHEGKDIFVKYLHDLVEILKSK